MDVDSQRINAKYCHMYINLLSVVFSVLPFLGAFARLQDVIIIKYYIYIYIYRGRNIAVDVYNNGLGFISSWTHI